MSKIKKFEGDSVDVAWDERLCIHIAECGRAKNELFVMGREPWCSPDIVALVEVADVVKRCPSGALTYQSKSSELENEVPPDKNTLHVTNNGPYFLRGDIDISGVPNDMEGVRFRAALCRCGQSSNKPFCDNSHDKAGFKDSGAVGDRGSALDAQGGKLKASTIADGPLVIEGNLTIYNGSGQQAWSGEKVFLCRCGASENKPFCDGSHKKIGFKST